MLSLIGLPCTFRDASSLTDVAPLGYITQNWLFKCFIVFLLFFFFKKMNSQVLFLLRQNLKVQIVVLEFQLNAIFILWNFFFLEVTRGSQRLKYCVGVFLNSIAFKSYSTFLKLQEKHAE